ncbi:transporter substrate-binding domain-containing protein [Devosia sp. WQ 349]|uniref:substrate-binding periplasmic protein n=1 Tax=Devosia sp. WQ 349K1 TaxID=2800329 RepID=UPI0019049143|nr:transporter substrate-binding domain-containing protein [Devosia sp. WQ 349K1]
MLFRVVSQLVLIASFSSMCNAANAISLDLPSLSSEFLRTETLLDDDTIKFCIYGGSAIGAYDRKVGQLLGDSLFLNVEFHEVEPPIVIPGMDTIPISLDDLFLMLTNECDAFMGLELASSVYPPWMNLTRAYLKAPYVTVVREGEYVDLSGLPDQAKVATQTLTSGDIMFNAYRDTQPEAQRYRRIPYPTTTLQFERLREHSVEAAIVWEPWFSHELMNTTGLEIVPNGVVRLPHREIGIAVRSRDDFIRSSLDQAIEMLEADGTLAETYAASLASNAR